MSRFLKAYCKIAWNFCLEFEPCQQNFIRKILTYSILKSEKSTFDQYLVLFLTFCYYFCNFSPYSINYVIKMYFFRIKSTMTRVPFLKLTTVVIIFWNLQTFYQKFLSQQVKRNVIITNENGKCELTDMLPNDARLKCPVFSPKWKYCQY